VQNSGGAAIPMQISSDKIEYLVGDSNVLDNMETVPALPTFSEKATAFLGALSGELFKDPRTRKNTDVMSYAYWIRKSSLEKTKEKHLDRDCRIGRGVVFHIAPSNVPVNFAVSMTSSLLAGNASVIRISNKPFEQVDIICDAMNRLLEGDFTEMKPYFCLIRYEHDDSITQALSDICDVRVIWGGNRTIGKIREAKLPPRAIELAFADRHSLALIDAAAYLDSNAEEVAKGFYTDTYYTDQNACSSPRLVVWTGEAETVKMAREQFWNKLEEIVLRDYPMKPIQAVDKYTSACMLGMSDIGDGAGLILGSNYVTRIEVSNLTKDLMNYKNGGGYFFEYTAENLEEIIPVLTKQCQTISVLGIEKDRVKDIVMKSGVRGVDRIVPLGQTMGLEFIWDGYKMIETMSRFIYTGDYC